MTIDLREDAVAVFRSRLGGRVGRWNEPPRQPERQLQSLRPKGLNVEIDRGTYIGKGFFVGVTLANYDAL